MSSPNATTDDVASLLLQNLKDGVVSGRIADMDTVQSAINHAMAVLKIIQPAELDSSHHDINDVIGTLVEFLETTAIRPSGSPNHQQAVRDDKREAITDSRRKRPLRREGAFRGPLEEIDWQEITRVYGRDLDQPDAHAQSPSSRRLDYSRPRTTSHTRRPSQTTARQHRSSASSHTDASRRVRPSELHLFKASSPNGTTSSVAPDLQPGSGEWCDSSSVPLSPSVEKGKKRAHKSGDDEEMPVASPTPKEGSQSSGRALKRKDKDTPETKRKRFESSSA